ncbi:hypothetical protein BROUX41_004380 [Berkeleyomyces rouxiae]|uniref:uncharacterized protein n=1 Tax=Berkeleyomyces rouxiae TaxID=2035830 RepID=UPI003B768681
MVSFWPWRGNSSSTTDFEKTLSNLSRKIATAQTSLDSTRTRARRAKVLLVLYLSFAYLVYIIVAFLVLGSQNMGSIEWTGVAGSPVVIYLLRRGVAAFYDFRIDALAAQLKELQTEREKTIQKLKDATKYDTTLELLEKYGGGSKSESLSSQGNRDSNREQAPKAHQKAESKGPGPLPKRTNLPPPPTANINRAGSPSDHAHHPVAPPNRPMHVETSEDFAPNAFGGRVTVSEQPMNSAPLSRTASLGLPAESHWYDRILDLLLGEDEKDPRNRIILMCQKCRLINGQAPPGVKTLAEIGVWKCMSCGASNGELDESILIADAVLQSKDKSQVKKRRGEPETDKTRDLVASSSSASSS